RGVRPDGGDRVEDVGDDRPVRGLAHRDLDVLAPGDLDRLGAHVQRHVGVAAQHAVPVDVLQVEVGDVGVQVGDAPRDVLVVADDDAGQAGEGEPADVERARLGDLPAVQAGLQPDARLAGLQVRVVGQDGCPGGGVLAGDDPRVGADALPGAQEP